MLSYEAAFDLHPDSGDEISPEKVESIDRTTITAILPQYRVTLCTSTDGLKPIPNKYNLPKESEEKITRLANDFMAMDILEANQFMRYLQVSMNSSLSIQCIDTINNSQMPAFFF